MDLTKMSVKDIEQWACNEEEYRNQPYYWQVAFDELACRLAAAEAQLAVAREGLVRLGDGDVEYHHGSYPEQGHYNEICAMQKEAQRTLAKLDQSRSEIGPMDAQCARHIRGEDAQ